MSNATGAAAGGVAEAEPSPRKSTGWLCKPGSTNGVGPLLVCVAGGLVGNGSTTGVTGAVTVGGSGAAGGSGVGIGGTGTGVPVEGISVTVIVTALLVLNVPSLATITMS